MFGVGVWQLVPSQAMWIWLTQCTFAIYVLHFSFLRLFYWMLRWTGLASHSSAALLIVIGVGFSVCLSALCARLLRRNSVIHMIVLGGR